MTEIKTKEILIEYIIRLVELSALDKAEDIAQMAHLNRSRMTGDPYMIHPKRVQLLAKSLGYALDIQIIAILHDVIEDAKNKEYYEDLIKQKFGNEVYTIIKLLSHDKNTSYEIYLKKLAKSHFKIAEKAFKVKMLDMFDNLTDAPTEKNKEKYRNAIQILVDEGIADSVPDSIFRLLKIERLTEAPKDTAKPSKDVKDSPEPDAQPDEPKADTQPNEPKVDEPKADAGPADSQEKADVPQDGAPTDGGPQDGEPQDSPMPDGGGTGGPGDDIFGADDSPGGDEPGADTADAENSIVKFNDKLTQSKIIDKQKVDAEPGFDFSTDNKFYRENYIATTKDGSLLIGVPSAIQNNADKDFIKTAILPKIIKIAYEAVKRGKDVVLLGDYGLPYYNGKYSNTTSGLIAKVLNDKFKNTILFDTWNPQDYYGFVSNIPVWRELKQRTEAENTDIKSALYLFLLATNRDKKVSEKLKTDNVLETLSKWGISDGDIEIESHEDEIHRVIFPDKYSSPETEASYIIKMYLQLLRVNMLKKVIQYEREGKVVIVPTDINTSWGLNKSFKDLQKLQQPKKEKPEEQPEKAPDAETQKNPEKQPPADKKPTEEIPKEKSTEK